MNESLDMNTIPGRVNDLEKLTHTLDHRLNQLENERLPHRVLVMEQTVTQVREDVAEIKKISQGTDEKLELGIAKLHDDALRQRAFIKGIMWVGGAVGASLITFMQLAPAISYAIRKLAS